MQLLGSRVSLRHQSVVAPRLHARCSAQRPDSALGLPLDEGSTHDVTQQSAQRPWSRMNRRTLLFQTALSLAACPCCVAPASAAGDAWDYGPNGPSSWPGTCKAGQAQSPIDIPTKGRTGSAAAGQRGDLDLEYSQTSAAGQRGELHMQYSTSSAAGQRGELNIHYGDLNLQYSQPSAAGGRGDLNLTYSQSSAAGGTGDLKLKYSQKQVGELELQYSQTSGATVKNTGHGALQVNVPKGNYCMLDGQKLELVQYHFHTPSEHTLDGAGTAMEAHLVHKNVSTGAFTVLGTLLQVGAGASIGALQSALQHSTGEAGVSSPIYEAVHPEQLVPSPVNGHRPFVRYPGSLTTPPCSEGVQWVVFADKLTIPPEQLAAYKKLMAPSGFDQTGNSRPLQDLRGRQLEYCWL